MAALQMLGEVLSAVERNEARMPRRLRVKWDERHATLTTFKLGFMVLVGSLIGAFVVGIAR